MEDEGFSKYVYVPSRGYVDTTYSKGLAPDMSDIQKAIRELQKLHEDYKNYWKEHMTEAEAKATGRLANQLGLTVRSNIAELTATITNKHGDEWTVSDKYVRGVRPDIFREKLREFAREEVYKTGIGGLIKWVA